MRVPHKIKVFAWRACLNGLPCFFNLLRKHIDIKGRCVFCDVRKENLAHALVYCPNVRKWWSIFLPELDCRQHPLSFLGLVHIFSIGSRGNISQHSLWLHGAFGRTWIGRFMRALTLAPKILIENALAYQGLFTEIREAPPHKGGIVGCWHPPEIGCKLNVMRHFLMIFRWLVLVLFLRILIVKFCL